LCYKATAQANLRPCVVKSLHRPLRIAFEVRALILTPKVIGVEVGRLRRAPGSGSS